MSFDELVSKLKSSHEEIRQRAIVNIADKLKYGVIDVNKIVDESDCCSSLVSLFSERLDIDVDIVSLQDFRSFSITWVSSIYREVSFVKSQHSFLDFHHLTILFQQINNKSLEMNVAISRKNSQIST